jgi:hypothetical protein
MTNPDMDQSPIPLPELRTLSPAQRLCWSLVEDTLNTLRRSGATYARDRGTTAAMLVAEARQWIAADDHGLGSFAWCCGGLGLAPDYVRRLIDEAASGPGWLIAVKPRSARTVDPARAAKRAHLQRWRAKRRQLR